MMLRRFFLAGLLLTAGGCALPPVLPAIPLLAKQGHASAMLGELARIDALTPSQRRREVAALKGERRLDATRRFQLAALLARDDGAESLERGFARELPEEQHLDGDDAVEADLPGAIHHPHAAVRDLLQQFVVAEVRLTENFIKMPGLNRLVSRMSMPYNVYIAHQDRRIVETEQPRRTNLKMDEKLIPADQPIIAYRRRREELISRTGLSDGPLENEAGLTADRQATKIEAI